MNDLKVKDVAGAMLLKAPDETPGLKQTMIHLNDVQLLSLVAALQAGIDPRAAAARAVELVAASYALQQVGTLNKACEAAKNDLVAYLKAVQQAAKQPH